MTSTADVALAVDAGADAVGVIFAQSPRRVERADAARLAAAIPPFVDGIAVVVNPSEDDAAFAHSLGFTLQFSGDETPARCEALAAGRPYVKAFHLAAAFAGSAPPDEATLAAYARATSMFDTRVDARYGGTGVPFAWGVVADVARRRHVIVSGGLTAANVGACVRALRPYAVDVRGGVESSDAKDVEKMRAFVRAVREADAQT